MHHPPIQSEGHWPQALCSPQVWSLPGGLTSWPQAHLWPCSLYSFFCWLLLLLLEEEEEELLEELDPETPQWPA